MIFVTGGTGFLGRHLIAALCRSRYKMRVLTRTPEKHDWLSRYEGVEVIRGDLLDKSVLMRAVEGCEYVIHAGALFRLWGKEENFMKTNALGTENVMEAALKAGVKRVVHISSVAVIGQPDPASIIDEDYPPRPIDPYQRSKYQAEQIVLRYYTEHQMPVIILRLGALYGPLGEYAFNRLFFTDPMRGIIMQVSGGRHIIFPLYITDAVDGIMAALEYGSPGERYNISGDWISHREAFDVICREARLLWPRLPIPGWLGIATSRFLEALAKFTGREPFWPINLRSYVYNNWRVSNVKARRELGFIPTQFRDGARQTITWYRKGRPKQIPETNC